MRRPRFESPDGFRVSYFLLLSTEEWHAVVLLSRKKSSPFRKASADFTAQAAPVPAFIPDVMGVADLWLGRQAYASSALRGESQPYTRLNIINKRFTKS
jgi:hypothetical protein